MRLPLATVLAAAACCSAAVAQTNLAVKDRGLIDQTGQPFFWLGDTAWGLFQIPNRDEVKHYLDVRARQGFSVIHAAVCHKNAFIGPPLQNALGDRAFLDDNPRTPLVTPGADPAAPDQYDYWDHVEFVVDEAANRGLRIVFVTIFGEVEGQGYNLINPDNANAYGRFLGARFGGKQNLIWCLGGDVLANNQHKLDTWEQLAKGICQGACGADDCPDLLMTFHTRGGHSTSDFYADSDLIDFDMLQTWAGYERIARVVLSDYRRPPRRPILHGEGAYEEGPEYPTGPITPHLVRKQFYWAVFSGGMHTYGNTSVWNFGANPKYAQRDWKEALESDGAACLSTGRKLLEEARWHEFEPATDLISQAGDPLTLAMRDEANGRVLVYFPTPAAARVSLAWLPKQGRRGAVWINPQDGAKHKAEATVSGKPVEFTPPANWEDALLLIESGVE